MITKNNMITEAVNLFNANPFLASETGFAGFTDLHIFPNTMSLEEKILTYLIGTGNNGKTRSQIVNRVAIARTTVYDALIRLTHKNNIEIDHRHSKGKRGRPQTLFFATNVSQGNRR